MQPRQPPNLPTPVARGQEGLNYQTEYARPESVFQKVKWDLADRIVGRNEAFGEKLKRGSRVSF
jgi:hypothetical protein